MVEHQTPAPDVPPLMITDPRMMPIDGFALIRTVDLLRERGFTPVAAILPFFADMDTRDQPGAQVVGLPVMWSRVDHPMVVVSTD